MLSQDIFTLPPEELLHEATRQLTASIAMEMSYATGLHRQALFATGVVLFVIIMLLNSAAIVLSRRRARG